MPPSPGLRRPPNPSTLAAVRKQASLRPAPARPSFPALIAGLFLRPAATVAEAFAAPPPFLVRLTMMFLGAELVAVALHRLRWDEKFIVYPLLEASLFVVPLGLLIAVGLATLFYRLLRFEISVFQSLSVCIYAVSPWSAAVWILCLLTLVFQPSTPPLLASVGAASGGFHPVMRIAGVGCLAAMLLGFFIWGVAMRRITGCSSSWASLLVLLLVPMLVVGLLWAARIVYIANPDIGFAPIFDVTRR